MRLDADQVAELAERRFEKRLIELLIAGDPAAGAALSRPEGLPELRAQIARARSHRVLGELDIARYVITAWTLGADFDERFPAMAEILQTNRLTPTQKADALERVCVEQVAGLQGGTRERR